MQELPTREIHRRGRYANCQILNPWGVKDPTPRFMVCNDLETGEVFLAKQGMGTWCEVDLQTLASNLNRLDPSLIL